MNSSVRKRRRIGGRISVRRTTMDDAIPFLRLEAQCFEMRFHKETSYYWRPIIDYCYSFKAVTKSGRLVGGIIAMPTREGEIYVNSLFVKREFRRRHVARMLMNAILKIRTEKAYVLDVRKEKQYLIRFYESLGFKKIYLRKNYYLDGTDRIIMRLAP